MADVPYI